MLLSSFLIVSHSNMSHVVRNLIEKNQQVYGLQHIINESFLDNALRTAFVWTKHKHSVCLAMGKNYLQTALNNPAIQVIITAPHLVDLQKNNANKSLVLFDEPQSFFYLLHNTKITSDFNESCFESGIDPTAEISTEAFVSKHVKIGARTKIYPGAIVLDGTEIGEDCVIHEGCTIGTEGFFSKWINGQKCHVSHHGGVKLGKNCIIHAGTNISKSVNSNEFTQLGDNTHVGIQSNISHDCQIGENCDISAKVCLSGRVEIGDNVWVGASVTISNNIKIHDGAHLKIGSVVIKDVMTDESVSGNFAMKHSLNMKEYIGRLKNA